MPVVSDYRAILAYQTRSTARWNANEDLGTGAIVTFSFPAGTDLPDPLLDPYGAEEYLSMSATQRDIARAALQEFAAVSGLAFVEVEGPAMINIFGADTLGGYSGWASYPWVTPTAASTSDLVLALDTGAAEEIGPGTFEYQTLLHEIGHAVGLEHTHDGQYTLAAASDHQSNTVMTYNNTYPPTQDLGPLDLQALQHLYGKENTFDGWQISAQPAGHVRVVATGGDDVILGPYHATVLKGLKGDDSIVGQSEEDRLFGGGGNDSLTGGDGGDRLLGGGGRDLILGGTSASGYSGTDRDRLLGGGGSDTLHGGGGHDQLQGGNGADALYGGYGRDEILGGRGGDVIYGDFGSEGSEGYHRDTLYGDNGADTLYGDAGNDRLEGGRGADVLYGGRGQDKLIGGAGRDVFVFTPADRYSTDAIVDFNLRKDRIDLSEFAASLTGVEDLSIEVDNGESLVSFTADYSSYEIRLTGVTDELTGDHFLFG